MQKFIIQIKDDVPIVTDDESSSAGERADVGQFGVEGVT